MQNTRVFYYDLIRASAICAVVLLHSISSVPLSNTDGVAWWLQVLLSTVSIWAVPAFIILSGSLLLTKQEPPLPFYKKRLLKVGIPTIVWITFYFVFNHYLYDAPLTPGFILKKLWYGDLGHLYFLIVILELYLVTPLLQKFIRALTPLYILLSISGLFLVAAVGGIFRHAVFLFVPLLVYYFIGYWVRKNSLPKFLQEHLSQLWIGSYLTLVISRVIGITQDISPHYYFTYGSPLVVVFSVLTFLLFREKLAPLFLSLKSHNYKQLITKLAEYTLGIYLIHQSIISIITKTIFTGRDTQSSLFKLLTIFLLTFTASVGVVHYLRKFKYLKFVI